MARIYISSTYEDLKTYRKAVSDALQRMGHHVIAMETYVASDQRPVDKCLKDVSESDVYIGIFAHRYGFVPPEANPGRKSITEMELRKALEEQKPCLCFF